MNPSALDVLNRRMPCAFIAAYQRHISPRKGFQCSHRLLHGDESCSGYVKRVIHERGLWASISIVRRRFENCKTAANVLRARRDQRKERETDGKQRSSWADYCDPCLPCDAVHCGSSAAHGCPRLALPADCAGIDCAGAHCIPIEVGCCCPW